MSAMTNTTSSLVSPQAAYLTGYREALDDALDLLADVPRGIYTLSEFRAKLEAARADPYPDVPSEFEDEDELDTEDE